MTAEDPKLYFDVPDELSGTRADRFLADQLEELGRRGVARLFAQGDVRINGRRCAKGDCGAVGDLVEVLAPEVTAQADPKAPFSLRHENEHYVVIAKPAGQASAPLSIGELGTAANALVARYPEMACIGFRLREPGLLHRLDTDTSGLLLAARTTEAFQILLDAFADGSLHKTYLAIVEGTDFPDSIVVNTLIRPHPKSPRKVESLPASEKPSARQTEFRIVKRSQRRCLVEATVTRAYRHQVRVQLAGLGYPIVGDELYGGHPIPDAGSRHALHANCLRWSGTQALAGFTCEEELPADMLELLAD